MSYILIIGDKEDSHIQVISRILEENNHTPIIFNPYKGSTNAITYSYNPFQILIQASGLSVDANQIKSVWWRLKPNITSAPDSRDEFERVKFIQREWGLTLEPLKYFLKNCFWINRREADSLTRNKPFQLERARQNGFKIPKSIISNNSGLVQEKTKDFNKAVYKPLSYFIVPPDRILYSSIMSQGEISEKSANIEQAPCIFQEYIDKDFELRITIVGGNIFPIKINSQINKATQFDWRKDQLNIEYELFELPKEIEKKLLKLHKEFKIFYGAYDFIVDLKGEYIFLEVNPAGQWLWMEEKLNLNISKSIAEALMLGAD